VHWLTNFPKQPSTYTQLPEVKEESDRYAAKSN